MGNEVKYLCRSAVLVPDLCQITVDVIIEEQRLIPRGLGKDRAAAEGVGGGAAHGLGRAYPICPVGVARRAVHRRQFPPVLPGEGLAPVVQGIACYRGDGFRPRSNDAQNGKGSIGTKEPPLVSQFDYSPSEKFSSITRVNKVGS